MQRKLLNQIKGILFTILWIFPLCAFAQNMTVRGTVTDANGELLIGVSVRVENTSIGTITDVEGNYELQNVSPDALLEVSYVGMVTRTIPVDGRSIINIILQEDTKTLEELVVVGYGTQKKGNLTAAISTIKNEDILTTTHTSLAQRLQGKIPGLQIRQNTGEPGNYDAMINIRGFGTPLFIIDGTTRVSNQEFQRLNPEDIESISILKDGAAAIYGMNAANGVILVTTKRGTEGKPKFQYSGSISASSPTDMPEVMNAYQWIVMRNDAAVNIGLDPIYTKEEVELWRQGGEGYESTDWYNETMKKFNMLQQHTFSVQGGSDKVNFYVSLGFLKDPGLLKTNAVQYEKYSFRSNLTARLSNNLSTEIDLSGWYDEKDGSRWPVFDIIRGTVSALPIHTPHANNNPDYPAYIYDGQSYNPIVTSNSDLVGYTHGVSKSFKSSASIIYDVPFVEGLELKGVAYYEHGNGYSKNLSKSYYMYSYDQINDKYVPILFGHPSTLSNGWSDGNGITLQAHVNYKRTFDEKHNLGFTGVYEERNGWSRSAALQREFQFFTIDQINMGDENNQRTSGMEDKGGFRSLLGRLNYDYLGKYLFELAARYDGSYRYHPDRRWGFFPVVSAGWRISEEDFMKNLSFISNLKLRGSYGVIGEDAGSPFQYVGGFTLNAGGYEFVNGTWTSGAAAPRVVNEDLTWYTSIVKDLGFDLGLLHNQINLEFDIYQRDRSGLLAYRNATLPNTFGASLPQENLNKDRVRGIDLAIGYGRKVTNDFSFNISGNVNFARRMDVYEERGPFVNSMDRWRSGHNERWSDVIWMYDYVGQFQTEEEIINAPIQNGTLGNSREMPGDFRYRDVNNDGVIDGNDVIPLAWGGDPKLHYGLIFDLKWKDFDFNMLWQGSGKYSVRFTHNYATMLWMDGNMPEYFYDRWHLSDQFNPNSEWIKGEWPPVRRQPDVGAMYNESSVWRRDASYLRLKSLEVGYSLPSKFVNSFGVQNLRLYISGYNLLTLTDPFVKSFDPERIEGAYNAGWVYPLNKSFNFGVNLTF
ncbi:MAG: TonB-linked outer membrane protein SusC/RagA family [Anaerophaga sp.]|nr:TonB-linked outer membrane protein SusC/RagA family [Anaerophaga sp.]